MSENINFIPATELPEAEGDEVSVLCIENGELKQKAASGLGGGGNTNYDIVVRIVTTYDTEEDEMYATCEIVSGSFDAVVQKLDNGIPPLGLYIVTGQNWDGYEAKEVDEFLPMWRKYQGKDEPCMCIDTCSFRGYLYPNGTIELDQGW